MFLSCENRYVGAVLFSVALLCICFKGYSLFTGKVGYIPEKHGKEEFSVLLLGLLGNAVATIICGLAVSYMFPDLSLGAFDICSAKLAQEVPASFLRGVFCGILMYLAVSIYRDKNTIAGILFCIPVFILCGFEHSIADMFYFAASGIVSLRAFLFIWIIIIGNSAGGMLLPVISGALKKKE